MVVQVVVIDPVKLNATIKSLRPANTKSDDVPKEVLCYVHHEVPVLTSMGQIDASLGVRPQSSDTLAMELTRPFTGLVLLAISAERTRLSIAMFPTTVSGLPVGETYKFAFFPGPLMKFLTAVKTARVILSMESERLVAMVNNNGTETGIKHKLQANFAYVADGDGEDGRDMFQTIPLSTGIRINGDEMLQSLSMIDPLVTLAVHEYGTGSKRNIGFTIAGAGSVEFLISYIVAGTKDAVVELRDGAVVKDVTEPPPVDEDLESIKARCEVPSTTDSDNIGEVLLLNARQYLRLMNPEPGTAKKVRFDHDDDKRLGTLVLPCDGMQYTLKAHGLVQSKQLIGLLTDHARSLEYGLTVLFGQQQTTSYIVLAMPLAGTGLVLHAVACSLAEGE